MLKCTECSTTSPLLSAPSSCVLLTPCPSPWRVPSPCLCLFPAGSHRSGAKDAAKDAAWCSADPGEGEQEEDGDDLVWWRGCLCSQQWQMKGGTGRIWGQAAVSVNWWQNIHTGRQFVSWDFNFCLSIPDLCYGELSRAVISSSLHVQELSFCNLSWAFGTSGESLQQWLKQVPHA